jgi:hypothetical protein
MSMNARKVFFAAVFGMWSWCAAQSQAQSPNQLDSMPAPVSPAGSTDTPTNAASGDHVGTGLSSWITYDRGNCCTGSGDGVPLKTEFFTRIGPSFPVGGEFFGRTLSTGWMVEGGVRAMFFNHEWSKAWAVELGVTNTYNENQTANKVFIGNTFSNGGLPVGPVTVRSLNRTYASLLFGREWYFGVPANMGTDCSDWRFRVGGDVGGRYGSEEIKIIETVNHHTDVTEGFVVALHTDAELPLGRWTLIAGIRTEYAYSFSNIIAEHHGSIQDISLLFNFGVRY